MAHEAETRRKRTAEKREVIDESNEMIHPYEGQEGGNICNRKTLEPETKDYDTGEGENNE